MRAAAAGAAVTPASTSTASYCIACHGSRRRRRDRHRPIGAAAPREDQQQGGPSLRGVGALAADFYLRTGYMPLARRRASSRAAAASLSRSRQIRRRSSPTSPRSAAGRRSRRRTRSAATSREGLQLFTDHCAGCHQVVARGRLRRPAPCRRRSRTRPTQIAEAVRIGPYVMPRFSPRRSRDRELDSIIRYVQYAKHPDDRGGWAIGHLGPVPEGLVTWFIAAATLVAVCLLLGRRLRHE